jgi:hypothetical protein
LLVGTSRSYPGKSDDQVITNKYVLDDALPVQVSDYVASRIARYQQTSQPKVDHFTIEDDSISTLAGKYVFTLDTGDPETSVPVSVEVKNYGNFFSISVEINGQTLDIS